MTERDDWEAHADSAAQFDYDCDRAADMSRDPIGDYENERDCILGRV